MKVFLVSTVFSLFKKNNEIIPLFLPGVVAKEYKQFYDIIIKTKWWR